MNKYESDLLLHFMPDLVIYVHIMYSGLHNEKFNVNYLLWQGRPVFSNDNVAFHTSVLKSYCKPYIYIQVDFCMQFLLLLFQNAGDLTM